MSKFEQTEPSDQPQAGASDQGGMSLSKRLVAGAAVGLISLGVAGVYAAKDSIDHQDTRPEQVRHEPNPTRTMLADLKFPVGNKQVEVTGWQSADGGVEVSTKGDPRAGQMEVELYNSAQEATVRKASLTPGETVQLGSKKENTSDNELSVQVYGISSYADSYFLVPLPRDGIEKDTTFGATLPAGERRNPFQDTQVDFYRGPDNALSLDGIDNTESELPAEISAVGPSFSQKLDVEGAGVETGFESRRNIGLMNEKAEMLEIQIGDTTVDLRLNHADQ